MDTPYRYTVVGPSHMTQRQAPHVWIDNKVGQSVGPLSLKTSQSRTAKIAPATDGTRPLPDGDPQAPPKEASTDTNKQTAVLSASQ